MVTSREQGMSNYFGFGCILHTLNKGIVDMKHIFSGPQKTIDQVEG